MKPAILYFFSSGGKRWGIFFFLLIWHISGPVTGRAQGISVQVDNYLKAQVKVTTIRGVMLVTENMTDWLNHTNAAPVNFKKTEPRNSSNVTGLRGNTMIAKLKCPAVSKTVKRP